MGLPGHRRTSSDKRRRAAHFALVKPSLTTDKAGRTHLMHRVAPGATEYNGIAIHVKGRERKLNRMLAKTKPAATKEAASKVDEHAGHDHAGHNHGPEKKTKAKSKKA